MNRKPLVIFGAGDIAQLAQFYFDHDTDYRVVAFTVDRKYAELNSAFGLPLIPFDDVVDAYPPGQFDLFIAISYAKVNQVRREKFERAKASGYHLASYVSSRATVMEDFRCGENCFILEDNTIQPFVAIGNNVTLWSGNHIGHHAVIEDHCFITSHVVVAGAVHVGEQSFLGINATLRDHITIGPRTVVGAGALIIRDTEPDSVYTSKPATRASRQSHELNKI